MTSWLEARLGKKLAGAILTAVRVGAVALVLSLLQGLGGVAGDLKDPTYKAFAMMVVLSIEKYIRQHYADIQTQGGDDNGKV
jgi:hypothetical protein